MSDPAQETRNERWVREYGYGLNVPGDINSILDGEDVPDPQRMENTWANKSGDRIIRENPYFD